MRTSFKFILKICSKSTLIFGCLALFLFASCGPARHLNEDEKLLTKVKIRYEGKKEYADELYSLSRQKPNRKFLGLFKIYLGVYNLFYNKEDSKLKTKLGEAPVIYDSTLSERSKNLMHAYLNNKGYYENEVSLKTKQTRKRVRQYYAVNKKDRFYISSLDIEINDEQIKPLYDSSVSSLKSGIPFDLDILNEERRRIELLLKNNGYHKFYRDYVVFEVDTFIERKEAKVRLIIQDPKATMEEQEIGIVKKHQVYHISSVIVRTDYTLTDNIGTVGDTALVDSILFVDFKAGRFDKNRFSEIVTIRPGELFQLKKQEQTYNNFSSLAMFNSVSIHFEEDPNAFRPSLTAFIDLDPRKQQSYTIQSEGTNNGGNLGINATVNYQNINTFRAAEVLNIGISGGIEAQRILTDEDDDDIAGGVFGFNTFEFGPSASLEVPRFVLPFRNSRFLPKNNPRTSFNASFNYQERPDYTRNITKTYIAYSWRQSRAITHVVQPFDLSFAKIDLSPKFSALLNDIQNPFLRNSYIDNLIMALSYSFIYNNQPNNKLRDYSFFRANIESAGNTLSLLTDGLNNNENVDGSFNIADVRYAQYIKVDFDYRHYQNFGFNRMVYRIAAGLGQPYGNSSAMPFEKSFYAGGANSNRAWRARELGPGTLPDSIRQSIDQIGNMKMEINLEYRFQVTKLLEGAAFIDAGNIWNVDQKDSREETQFKMNKLWDATAIGMGVGVRLNFAFFVLRFDIAAPFKDPGKANPERFKLRLSQSNLNLGIGYPF